MQIQKALLNTPKRRRRVACEIALHQSLPSHPSIVRFEHSFEDEINIYILTEFCSGSTLFTHIQDHHPTGLAESQASPIFLSLVQAVSFLHDHDILHRDLKLTNVLLTNTLQVRIADFGLATRLEDATLDQEMTMCGTPNYISPEVVKRDPYGLASDVWSLGCMLVSLLTGRPPFQGEHISETLSLVARGAYRPLSRGCSRDVKSLVDSILQVDPRRRPTIPQIMLHPFMKSALANFDPNRSPLTDTLYGLQQTRNKKTSPKTLHLFNSPMHITNRVVPNKFNSTYRTVDRVKSRLTAQADQGMLPNRDHGEFNFGETVHNREHNPWSQTASSSYRGLLSNLRSRSNQGYDHFSAGNNYRNGGDNKPPSARTSAEDASDLESFDDYQKHRQEIPAEIQQKFLPHGLSDSTNIVPTRSVPLPQDHYPHASDLRTNYDAPQGHEVPFRSGIHPRAQRTFITTTEPVRHSMVAHVEDRFSQQYNDDAVNGQTIHKSTDHITRSVVPLVDTQQVNQAIQSRSISDSQRNIHPTVPDTAAQIEPIGQARDLADIYRQHGGSVNSSDNLGRLTQPNTKQNDRFQQGTNLVDLVDDIVLLDEQAGNAVSNAEAECSTTDDKELTYDLVTRYKFSTADLKATSQVSKHGEVSIDESGQVNVRLAKDDRRLLISANGMDITIISDDQAQRRYSLEELPARCLMAYRYASKFVHVARSKTVKIALDSNIAKCRLYLNDNFEVILLKEERKIGFNPHLRTIKIADHHTVLWKGHLDEVDTSMRDYVRQALIWWGRCREAMEDTTQAAGSLDSTPSTILANPKSSSLSARFIDGLGWCEQREDGKVWILFFLDGVSMELYTVTRLLRLTDHEGIQVEHKLEAGLPDNVRKRLKLASKAMKAFV